MADEPGGAPPAGGKSDTVTIPKIGKIKKKNLYLALAVVAGVAGVAWFYYLRSGAPAEPAATTQPEEGFLQDDIGETGGYYYGSGGAGSSSVIGSAIATNAQWFTTAMDALTAAGWDSQPAATALGKYLDKQPLTAVEETMVRVALAAAGPPPEGGPYTIQPGGTQPAPSAPPGTPSSVKAAFTGYDSAGGKARVSWAPVTGAVRYRVDVGTQRLEVTEYNVRTTGTVRDVRGLKPGSHIALVTAVNASGKEGRRGGPATFTVPKKPVPPKQTTKKK